jgi:two-component system, sensor histidine kinase and response regulator
MKIQGNLNDSQGEILIVEDSPTQAERLRYILEQHRYTVLMASNGQQALACLSQRTPALVISDIVMPEMDGYQLCQQIKTDQKLKDTPVILLTSLSDPEDVIKGLECRADNFITKPYDESYLLARVEYALVNRAMRQGERLQMGVEIAFGGQKHLITSDRQQILDLLISTYEALVRKNRELTTTRDELYVLNERLEELVEERTAALTAEVSARKQAEEEIRKLNAELEQRVTERTMQLEVANLDLENANQAKDRFLAGMSHELRTPLNAIIGFTGTLLMLLPGPLNADQQKQLRTIQTSAHHLLSLINDLLDLAKIESGKATIHLESLVCQGVIDEVLTSLRPLAEAKGLQFEAKIPAQDVVVWADRRGLSQILINLVSNAIKFTEQGIVRLELSQYHANGHMLTEISVADTGIGIRPADQAALFQAFTQVDAPPTHQSEGTGLGLYLSRKLASMMGGQITLQSEYGKGSTFTLVIPKQ